MLIWSHFPVLPHSILSIEQQKINQQSSIILSLGISNNWEDNSNINLLAACCCKPSHMISIWTSAYIDTTYINTIHASVIYHYCQWFEQWHTYLVIQFILSLMCIRLNERVIHTTPTDFTVSLNCNILSSISNDNSNGYWL